MCAAKSPNPNGLTIPSLTIRSGPEGTTIVPELMQSENGSGVVRSLKIEMAQDDVTTVTAELLPSDILLMLKGPKIAFTADGQEVAAMTLRDGTVIQFD